MKQQIRSLRAWEILDSRGNATIAVEVVLTGGASAQAHVPAGASTGRHEAVALPAACAAANVNAEIARAVVGLEADVAAIETRLIELDGTNDKSRLGANAILGTGCALARALSAAAGIPLWRYLRDVFAPTATAAIPLPMINILSGGLHAGGAVDFQDFLVIPHGFATVKESLWAAVAIHRAARMEIARRGLTVHGVADEGGWGPPLARNQDALEVLTGAIEAAGFKPGVDASIGLDVASSHFHSTGAGYQLNVEDRSLDSAGMTHLLAGLVERYPVISIEDGLAEDDWAGWAHLTASLGSSVQLIGDDLFTTNTQRVERGIASGVANSVLVKMNQIGSLTETFAVIEQARRAGYSAVISARSGETEDSFLADLAVASGAGQIKVGSITRSERLAKYNRLLEMEQDGQLPFARAQALAKWLR